MRYKFDIGDKVVHVLDRGSARDDVSKPQKVVGIILERSQRECYRHAQQNSYQVRWLSQGQDPVLSGHSITFNANMVNHSEIELEVVLEA